MKSIDQNDHFIILKSAKTQKISRILAQCLDNDRFSPLRFGTKGEKSRTRVGFIIGSLCGSMKNRKKICLISRKRKVFTYQKLNSREISPVSKNTASERKSKNANC